MEINGTSQKFDHYTVYMGIKWFPILVTFNLIILILSILLNVYNIKDQNN